MWFLHRPKRPRVSVFDLDKYHTATSLSLRERRSRRGSTSFVETWRFSDIDFGPQTIRFHFDVVGIGFTKKLKNHSLPALF